MDHYTLSDELRRQLLENAAWGKAGVAPRLDEASCESDDEKPAKKKKAKKARKDKEEDRDDEEEEEEVEESAELDYEDYEDYDEEDLEEAEVTTSRGRKFKNVSTKRAKRVEDAALKRYLGSTYTTHDYDTGNQTKQFGNTNVKVTRPDEYQKRRDEANKLKEEEEVHVCPLCVSELSEAIEEDRIFEHLNVVMALVDRLSQLQEGEEDIEAVIESTVEDLLFQDEE